jgi:hypothetical protein
MGHKTDDIAVDGFESPSDSLDRIGEVAAGLYRLKAQKDVVEGAQHGVRGMAEIAANPEIGAVVGWCPGPILSPAASDLHRRRGVIALHYREDTPHYRATAVGQFIESFSYMQAERCTSGAEICLMSTPTAETAHGLLCCRRATLHAAQ